MKLTILIIVSFIVGTGLGVIKNKGWLKRYSIIYNALDKLVMFLDKYCYLIIFICICIQVLLYYNDIIIINCAGSDNSDKDINLIKVKLDRSMSTSLATTGFLAAGAKFSQQFPTPAGKLSSMGFTAILGSIALAFLNKDRKFKNEGIDQDKLIEAMKDEYTTKVGEYVDLFIDIYHMNSIIITGMFILLNVFIALSIKGQEDKILKYIFFIKKDSNKEKWLKWYIDKWIKSSIFVFILVWISIMFSLLVIKYLIFKYILT